MNGVDYSLFDTVYLKNGAQPEPHIGKIIKIWGTPSDKTRKIKIQRFIRPCEISKLLTGIKIYYNELFLSCGDCTGLALINPLVIQFLNSIFDFCLFLFDSSRPMIARHSLTS